MAFVILSVEQIHQISGITTRRGPEFYNLVFLLMLALLWGAILPKIDIITHDGVRSLEMHTRKTQKICFPKNCSLPEMPRARGTTILLVRVSVVPRLVSTAKLRGNADRIARPCNLVYCQLT